MKTEGYPPRGLYHPAFEHDSCGIGAVVDIQGKPSHRTVDDALKIVEKLEHRAGKDAEGKTGDGVGILVQISHRFFAKAAQAAGIDLPGPRDYGVGMFFFPQDTLKRSQAKKMFEVIAEKEGLAFLGWRTVPVCPDILGQKARDKMPVIEQAFVARPEDTDQGLPFDRRLYIVRRVFEQSNDNTYVPSLSSRTIVYKGMFLVGQLRKFYPDLQSKDYQSADVAHGGESRLYLTRTAAASCPESRPCGCAAPHVVMRPASPSITFCRSIDCTCRRSAALRASAACATMPVGASLPSADTSAYLNDPFPSGSSTQSSSLT